jgi:hypothetical protein
MKHLHSFWDAQKGEAPLAACYLFFFPFYYSLEGSLSANKKKTATGISARVFGEEFEI